MVRSQRTSWCALFFLDVAVVKSRSVYMTLGAMIRRSYASPQIHRGVATSEFIQIIIVTFA